MGRRKLEVEAVLALIDREGENAHLSRGEAAAFIGLRKKKFGERDSTARNRIGMQLNRSCALGDDILSGGLPRQPDGKFLFRDIVLWATYAYPGDFDDLAVENSPRALGLVDAFGFNDKFEGVILPATVEECHEQIANLHRNLKLVHIDLRLAVKQRNSLLGSRFATGKEKK